MKSVKHSAAKHTVKPAAFVPAVSIPSDLTRHNAVGKVRRPVGDPVAVLKDPTRFIPVPQAPPTLLKVPLSLFDPASSAAATTAGKLVFHCVGDTGGIHGTATEEAIAVGMEHQITGAAAGDAASFFYNLGDVIYFNGQSALYKTEFYEPYQFYPKLIFAIPGNHDGDTFVEKGDTPDTEPSLFGIGADASGNVYVSDYNNDVIRTLTPLSPSTVIVANGASNIGYGPGGEALPTARVRTAGRDGNPLPNDHDPALLLLGPRRAVRNHHRAVLERRRKPRRPRPHGPGKFVLLPAAMWSASNSALSSPAALRPRPARSSLHQATAQAIAPAQQRIPHTTRGTLHRPHGFLAAVPHRLRQIRQCRRPRCPASLVIRELCTGQCESKRQ